MRLAPSLSRMLLALALAMGAMGLPTAALGLAFTERIENPLPVEYRDRAAELLKTVRPKDAVRSLDGVKALLWSGQNRSDIRIIMRVELDCPDGHCMTLVGRVNDRSIDLDFVLEAGPVVHFADVSFNLWESMTEPPWTFQTRGGAGVVAVMREQGWVLTACGNCTGDFVKHPPRLPPPPALKFDNFESFRRALEDKGLNR